LFSLWRWMVICPKDVVPPWGAGSITGWHAGWCLLAVAPAQKILDLGTATISLAAAACAVQLCVGPGLESILVSLGCGHGAGCVSGPGLPLASAQVAGPLTLETGSAVFAYWVGVRSPWLVAADKTGRWVLWRNLRDLARVGLNGKDHAIDLARLPSGQQGLLVLRRRPRSWVPAQRPTLESWNAVLLPWHS